MWSNGQDAVDYLLCGNYDGAVLDIMMPKKDGLTALKEVRDKGLALPALLLTAKSEIDDRVAGLDGGADDYLTKPFATQELLARIRAMTRRQPQLQSGVIRFGDLSLDRSSFRLTGPKSEMRLGNRDFQILEMLLEHPSQVISTERFLEKSGAMTVTRTSAWYGYTCRACGKSWGSWGPVCRFGLRGAWATAWRPANDRQTAKTLHSHHHAIGDRGAGGADDGHQSVQLCLC